MIYGSEKNFVSPTKNSPCRNVGKHGDGVQVTYF